MDEGRCWRAGEHLQDRCVGRGDERSSGDGASLTYDCGSAGAGAGGYAGFIRLRRIFFGGGFGFRFRFEEVVEDAGAVFWVGDEEAGAVGGVVDAGGGHGGGFGGVGGGLGGRRGAVGYVEVVGGVVDCRRGHLMGVRVKMEVELQV